MTGLRPIARAIGRLPQSDRVTEHWAPKVIARVNEPYVKVAKLLGEMDWPRHAAQNEPFCVLRGQLRLAFGDHVAERAAGQRWVVPRGVEHHPVAAEECWIVLVETVTIRHTGDLGTSQSRSIEEQLA